jgi:hypothetical protein
LIVALDGGSDGLSSTPEFEDSPPDTPASRNGHASLFDRVTWGSGQEPVIYE